MGFPPAKSSFNGLPSVIELMIARARPFSADSLLAPIKRADGPLQQKNIGFPIDKPEIPDIMRSISLNGITTDHVLVGPGGVSCSQTAINIRVPLRRLWRMYGDQGDLGFSTCVHHFGAYRYCR